MISVNKQKGFTLIELLMVISIIALLSSFVLTALNDSKIKGADAAKIRALQEIRTALQLYSTDKGYYPGSTFLTSELVPKYISFINLTGIFYRPINSFGTVCAASTNCVSYHLGTVLQLGNNVNKVLNNDKDSSNIFQGKSTDCGAVASTDANERCYDIEP